MSRLLAIALKDLRLRVRDRSVFIVALLAPAALALIFTLIFGDLLDPAGPSFEVSFGVVDLDGSAPSGGLAGVLDAVAESDQFDVTVPASLEAAEQAVADGELDAVFIVREGFGAAIEAGESAQLEIVGNVDAPTASGIAAAIAEGYGQTLERITLAVGASLADGATHAEIPTIVAAAQGEPPVATIGDVAAEVRQMTGSTFAMAGMAVFFLFFTVQFGVASLIEERQLGTWSRLMSAPVGRRTVIGAKALVSFVLGVVSMAVLLIGAALGLGAEWGDPVAVALLVVLGVLAATGVMAIVAASARTVEGAGNIQAIIAVTLGMLGGTFVPIAADGGVLATLSKLTPHHWFLRALNDLAPGGGVGDVLPSIGAIATFAAVCWLIAIGLFWRKAEL